jgi:hypothetical protein
MMAKQDPEFVGLIQEVFGAKKWKTEEPFPILPSKPKRTIGDASLFAEAQRIYNPAAPMTPGKVPPAKMQDMGTGAAMDMDANRYLGR